MFQLVANKIAASEFRHDLLKVFSKDAEKVKWRLSTPAGSFEADILVRADLGIWAYLGKQRRSDSYNFWVGVGKPTKQAAIEINIPARRTLRSAGQIVKNQDGALCLAHRGGLGGGKYSVPVEVFCNLIDGFERDVVLDGAKELPLFVIGSPEEEDFLRRLAEYTREAVRIRLLRKDERAYRKNLTEVGLSVTDKVTKKLNDEPGAEGAYLSPERVVAIRRIHKRVHKALVIALKRRQLKPANGRLHGGIGPDLYLVDSNDNISTLFEIKVGRDAQSTFTALGQLLVYAEQAPKTPQRILVTQGLPKSKYFKSAFIKHKIDVLYYRLGPKVIFENFNDISF
ncbi:MAG: hypothetical protein ACK4MV_04115 [Beijerinckiaceae bacterium]